MEDEFGAWNAYKTAFYALEDMLPFGDFGVYDFSTGQAYKLDMKYGTVTVSGWEGDVVYLTVQPYTRDETKTENQFCSQPSYAAQFVLNENEAGFKILRQSPDSNITVNENGDISETPFQSECTDFYG